MRFLLLALSILFVILWLIFLKFIWSKCTRRNLDLQPTQISETQHYRAGLKQRLGAAIFDEVFVRLPFVVLGHMLINSLIGNEGTKASFFIISFLNIVIVMGYYFYFSYLHSGQTIGKRLFRIRIIGINNQPVKAGALLLREILNRGYLFGFINYTPRLIFLWPLTFILLIVANKRTLQDIVVGTQVIKKL